MPEVSLQEPGLAPFDSAGGTDTAIQGELPHQE